MTDPCLSYKKCKLCSRGVLSLLSLVFIQFEKALQVHDTLLYYVFLRSKDHTALEAVILSGTAVVK